MVTTVTSAPWRGNERCVDSDTRGTLCVICLEAHVKSSQGVMGRQSGWRHEPRSYKACSNKAVTSFLCLYKRSVWNCPCLIWCCLSVFNYSEMASKQHNFLWMCVHPCPCYLTGGDTHVLCAACLGEEHARSVLEGTNCEHCDVLPLQTLRSHLAFFHKEGAQARVPQGSGPTVTEAQWRLQSWVFQIDLSAG